MNRRHAAIALIVILAIAAGALREFLFLNLYYQIDHLAHHRTVSYAHSLFQRWTTDLDLRTLGVLKWVFSLAFLLIMLGFAIALARALTGDHRYRRALIAGYFCVALLALAAYLAGPPWAPVGTKLLHALQYPVVLFLVWAASTLRARRT